MCTAPPPPPPLHAHTNACMHTPHHTHVHTQRESSDLVPIICTSWCTATVQCVTPQSNRDIGYALQRKQPVHFTMCTVWKPGFLKQIKVGLNLPSLRMQLRFNVPHGYHSTNFLVECTCGTSKLPHSANAAIAAFLISGQNCSKCTHIFTSLTAQPHSSEFIHDLTHKDSRP